MSKTILRAIFAVAFAVTGFLLGSEAFAHLLALRVANQAWLLALKIAAPAAGAVLGLFVVPLAQSIFELELGETEKALERLSPPQVTGGAIGLIVGLLIAWLVKSVLFEFITGAGHAASYLAVLLFLLAGVFTTYLGARVGAKLHLGSVSPSEAGEARVPKLLDTSVIIDGRIVEIAQSGFLEGPLIVPRFVLRELQLVADSADASKRVRGRYGLEMLAKLQELMPLDIDERDYDEAGVDAKLLRAAHDMRAKLITNDYNLSRVAQVEGVTTLSVNALSDAVRQAILSGEELRVTLVREGKEQGQAVGYLDDGTMIVVEQGRRFLGKEVDVCVSSVLRTVAGRMIFAKIKQPAESVL